MPGIKIGILQLYLKLYDEVLPELVNEFTPLIRGVTEKFEKKGFEVLLSPVCRLEKEFKESIADFEKHDVDAIVTLHLAYSPSLEAIRPLADTKIPIVVMDTTIKNDFITGLVADDVMRNHGIHGVQDMCNMLLREGKRFLIEAGHWEKSDLLDRLEKKITAAALYGHLSSIRTGIVGGSFYGMGDFYVPFDILEKDLGIKTVQAGPGEIVKFLNAVTEAEIEVEADTDKNSFSFDFEDSDKNRRSYYNTLRINSAFRKWMEKEKLNAFTINFASISQKDGFPTLPFMEASKAMARGVGYAGEGDVLTASLAGSVLGIFPESSFAEMFCPDWKNDLILLSHMGEINPGLISGRPKIVIKDLPFIDVGDPAVIVGQFKEGDAVFANLSPSKKGYRLILSNVEMVDVKNDLKETVTGWVKTKGKVGDYLAEFSRLGGTHHSVLIYKGNMEILKDFGYLAGFEVAVL